MKKWFFILLGVSFILTSCGHDNDMATTETTELHISVAASLKDVMDNVKKTYEKENPETKLTFDFAGSGQIKERVKSGAPIDGILLASEKDIDELSAKTTEKTQFAKNALVLIVPSKNAVQISNLNELSSFDKIAIGDPESVPAGKYAEETMQNLGVYTALKEKLVFASDVRQTLAYVASGNAQAGFVYQTDALISKDVKVSQSVPENLHSPIGYYAGLVKDSTHKAKTREFLQYMTSKKGQEVLAKYGFKPVD